MNGIIEQPRLVRDTLDQLASRYQPRFTRVMGEIKEAPEKPAELDLGPAKAGSRKIKESFD